MAVKKSRRRHNNGSPTGKKKDRARIAAELAPVEERGPLSTNALAIMDSPALLEPGEDFVDGTIVLDYSSMPLPSQIAASEDMESGPHPVFVVVVAIALGFVAFIAYLIHLENY